MRNKLYFFKRNSVKLLCCCFVSLLLTQFTIFSKSIESKWFLEISKFLNYNNKNDYIGKLDILKYHTILFDLQEIRKAFGIFRIHGIEETKYDFIRNILNNKNFRNKPDKKILKFFLQKLLELKIPDEVDTTDELITIAYLMNKINVTEAVLDVLNLIEKKIPETKIEWGCAKRANYFSQIYKIYKLLKKEKDAERILKKMVSFYPDCYKELLNRFSYDESHKKYIIFLNYSKVFIELKEFEKAESFIDKAIDSISGGDYLEYVQNMFEIADMYFQLGKSEKANEIIDKVFNFCFCDEINADKTIGCEGEKQIRKAGESVSSCINVVRQNISKSLYFKAICPLGYIEKLKKKMMEFKGQVSNRAIEKLLIELWLAAKEYDKADKLSKTLDNTGFEENERSEYTLGIFTERINDGFEIDVNRLAKDLKGTYYKIELFFEAGKYHAEQEEKEKSRENLKKAAQLLKGYKPEHIMRPYGIDLMKVGELYWKIGDIEGLTDIKEYYRKKRPNDYGKKLISEISKWQIDIYLSNQDYVSALKVLSGLKDPNYEVIGLLYVANSCLIEGDMEKGKKYFSQAYSILEKSKSIDYSSILDEFYRLFIFRKNYDKKFHRRRFIEVGYTPEIGL